MKQSYKILLAEDDRNLGMLLQEYLSVKNYDTHLFTDGEMALEAYSEDHFDLCLLDVMMPKLDGFTLAKMIRKTDKKIPIIFLTAKTLKNDLVKGFESGADDYLTKPFSMDELVLRIEAIMRRVHSRVQTTTETFFKIGNFSFDTQTQILSIGEKKRHLTTKETELLKLLCANKNTLLERDDALNEVWAENSYFSARSMDVYITKLRKILKEDPRVRVINVHGKGFKLVVDGENKQTN